MARNTYSRLITFQAVASYTVRGSLIHMGGSQFKAASVTEAKKVAAAMFKRLKAEYGGKLNLSLYMVAPDGNSIGLVKTYG